MKSKPNKYISKAYGHEPTLENLDESSDPAWELHKSVNWYRCGNTTKSKEKKWVLDYVTTVHGKKEVDAYSSGTPGQYDFVSAYCRTASRVPKGITIPKGFIQTIDKYLVDIKNTTSRKKADRIKSQLAGPKTTKTIQDRIAEQVSEYLGDIEQKLDDVLDGIINKKEIVFDVGMWLVGKEVKSMQSKMIAEYLEKTYCNEMQELMKGQCDQLKEAYDFMTRPQQKKWLKNIEEITKGCYEHGRIAVKPRRARKRKMKTPTQIVSKMKYENSNEEYKLVSVRPEDIIGASKLIVFNTKYRQLTIYHAKDLSGLSVKGSTLQNFSSDQSETRRLRKPHAMLQEALKGIRAFDRAWGTLKTKPTKPTGRINDNTIILKAVT
jgi:hypothetical protein